MKEAEIFKILKKLLHDNCDKEVDFINRDTFLANASDNALELTSLEIVGFIVDIEEYFNTIVDYDVVFITIGDIIDYIKTTLATNEETAKNE